MNTRKIIQGFSAVAIAVTFASGAFAQGNGSPAQGMPTERIVKLDTGSKYLNVRHGEVVTIVNGAEAFTWRFDTLNNSIFELAKIAPRDFGTSRIVVYVADNAPTP